MLSKLVAFDTNVYMGNNAKDPKVIAQVLKTWSLISPSIIILVPIVSLHLHCFLIIAPCEGIACAARVAAQSHSQR